jgi:beta-lactam-binding protein with PASTA domain
VSAAVTEYVPPVSGPFPAQAAPPRPPRNRPPQQARPPARKGRGGSIALWSAIAVLVLALVGTSTWWFTSGRYRTVPDVATMARADAEQTLRSSDLDPQIKTERHNTVPAGTVIRTDPEQGQEILRGDAVTMYVSLGKPKVPEVREGADPDEIEDLIRKQGLQPDRDDGQNRYDDDVEKGKVVSVTPQPGTELNIGERVVIVLSKGPEPKPIPDVRNKTKDEAFQELSNLGYTPVEGTAEFSPEVEGGRVVKTSPEIGTKIEGDDKTVTVILSTAVTVPDLGSQSADQAVATLQGLGLQVEIQAFGGGSGRVIGQSPSANSKVEPGSKVVIWVIP